MENEYTKERALFMPNNTPVKYKKDYQLYPGKPWLDESADECTAILCIEALGRTVGKGPGHSMKKRQQPGHHDP